MLLVLNLVVDTRFLSPFIRIEWKWALAWLYKFILGGSWSWHCLSVPQPPAPRHLQTHFFHRVQCIHTWMSVMMWLLWLSTAKTLLIIMCAINICMRWSPVFSEEISELCVAFPTYYHKVMMGYMAKGSLKGMPVESTVSSEDNV